MDKVTLKQKLLQLFVVGYRGTEIPADIFSMAKDGIGGIIFFAENLKSRKSVKQQIVNLNNVAKIPLFLSIDQEGGLVERTIFLDEHCEYLTPYFLSKFKNRENFRRHYEILVDDLLDLGINLNFAPVLDVNTNPNNPIIGVRAFSDCAEKVIDLSKEVIDIFKTKGLISCGKHFAGHGDTSVDSHINMPFIDIPFEKFYNQHLICFKKAIDFGIDTIMVSHVHFSFFDKEKNPASLSKNAIDYLKNNLNFKGIIFSDDMVMGGVSEHYGLKESILKGLNAGIESFIFREVTPELLMAIDEIVDMAINDCSLLKIIDDAYSKILAFKNEKIINSANNDFSCIRAQKIIDTIAVEWISSSLIRNFLPLNQNKKIKIILFNYKDIYNLTTVKSFASFFENYVVEEIIYPINPGKSDIDKIISKLNNDDIIIFVSYNANINIGQVALFNSITAINKILISMGIDDTELFDKPESVFCVGCYKTPVLKALANALIKK